MHSSQIRTHLLLAPPARETDSHLEKSTIRRKLDAIPQKQSGRGTHLVNAFTIPERPE